MKKQSTNITTVITTLIVVILMSLPAFAETLITLEKPDLDDIEVVGFELSKSGKISIEAVGMKLRYRDDLNVYAWIINHNTRQPVWEMKERHTDKVRRNRSLRKEETDIDFDKGKYELYLYSGSSMFSNISIRGTSDFFEILGDIFDSDRDEEFEDYLDECYVKLSSDEISTGDVKQFEVTGDLPDALLRNNKLGDSEYIQKGFTLDKAMNLRIYSVFEFPKGYRTAVDYGWIINANTRERVWEIDRWNAEKAGGDRKNRMVDDEIELEKGDYLLYFVTDDSHSYEEFNANPPYDPLNWGITILPGKDFDRSKYHIFEPPGKGEMLVDLTRVRDDRFLDQPFRLNKKTNLRIYALGEYPSSGREFADYGWIQDAATGEMVWEMTKRNTEHAGGARKNRMFDGDITLPAGEYIAYYMTDDSHSYRDWNDSPPFDPDAWGLAIYPGADYKKGDLKKLSRTDITQNSNILVKMVMIRDHDKQRDKLTLDKQTRIHIYAIGEGDRDEMYDYGWIVDDRTGRAVWEMNWRNTEPAGGARKNRLYNDNIILDPGTYEVYYITDGSHSFNDWNAAKPRDPINWGITVSKVVD